MDHGKTDRLAMAHSGTIVLRNVFVSNGVLIIISSKMRVSWNIALYILVSIIFSSSCVLTTFCELYDLFNLNPNGAMVNAAQGLTYVQFIFLISALHYRHNLHPKGILNVSLRHISLFPTGVLREFLFFALAMFQFIVGYHCLAIGIKQYEYSIAYRWYVP